MHATETSVISHTYDHFVQKCKINSLNPDQVRKAAGISRQVLNQWRECDPKTVQLINKLFSELGKQAADRRQYFVGSEALFAGNLIRTYSGVYVNVFDPTPDMFLPDDIAEGLAYNFRWRGHSKVKITVAEHCVRAVWYAMQFTKDKRILRAVLFHDGSEGVLGDLASPIKALMPDYKVVEAGVMACIAQRFNFDWPLHDLVKMVDREMLGREWEHAVLNDILPSWSPEVAKEKFLTLYAELSE